MHQAAQIGGCAAGARAPELAPQAGAEAGGLEPVQQVGAPAGGFTEARSFEPAQEATQPGGWSGSAATPASFEPAQQVAAADTWGWAPLQEASELGSGSCFAGASNLEPATTLGARSQSASALGGGSFGPSQQAAEHGPEGGEGGSWSAEARNVRSGPWPEGRFGGKVWLSFPIAVTEAEKSRRKREILDALTRFGAVRYLYLYGKGEGRAKFENPAAARCAMAELDGQRNVGQVETCIASSIQAVSDRVL